MSQPFVAEIQIFAFNFAPKGWAFCAGQLLPLSQNTALFSLLGTTYGGDGKSNFALPNLNGLTPLRAGQGPGLSLYDLGEQTGSQTVSLLQSEMPSHGHTFSATANAGTAGRVEQRPARRRATTAARRSSTTATIYLPSGAPNTAMSPLCTSVYGGSQPHNNMQPYLGLNFCIALQGVFPPRG